MSAVSDGAADAVAADAVAPWRGPAAAQRAGRTTIAAPAARDAAAGPPACCGARGAAGRLDPRRAPPDATSKGLAGGDGGREGLAALRAATTQATQ